MRLRDIERHTDGTASLTPELWAWGFTARFARRCEEFCV